MSNHQKSVENETGEKVQVLRKGVRTKERNAEVLLRRVPDDSGEGKEETAAGLYECRWAGDWPAMSGVHDVLQGSPAHGVFSAVCLYLPSMPCFIRRTLSTGLLSPPTVSYSESTPFRLKRSTFRARNSSTLQTRPVPHPCWRKRFCSIVWQVTERATSSSWLGKRFSRMVTVASFTDRRMLGICEVWFLPISSNFVNFCRFSGDGPWRKPIKRI